LTNQKIKHPKYSNIIEQHMVFKNIILRNYIIKTDK